MLTKQNKSELSINFDLLRERFEYEIKYLNIYLTISDKSNTIVNDELADKAFNETLKNPENESLIQDLFEREYKAINSYQYHSQLILIYGIYESTLTHLCLEFFKITKPKLSLDKIKGGNIATTCIEYLVLMSDFNKESIEVYLPKLNNYRLIRNYIAHQNSKFTGNNPTDIEKDKKKFENYISVIDKTNFDVNEDCFYIINNSVNFNLVDIVKKVINKIIDNLESKIFLINNID